MATALRNSTVMQYLHAVGSSNSLIIATSTRDSRTRKGKLKGGVSTCFRNSCAQIEARGGRKLEGDLVLKATTTLTSGYCSPSRRDRGRWTTTLTSGTNESAVICRHRCGVCDPAKKALKIRLKHRLLEFQPLSASEPPLDGAEAGQEGRGRLLVNPRRW